MIGLVEVVEHHLPVAGQVDGAGLVAPPGLQVVAAPLVPDGTEEGLQAHALGVHVHPDEAGEGFAGQLRQPHLAAGVALREVLPIRHEVEFPIGHEGPTVVLADKPPNTPLVAIHQRIAAMLADVVEGLHAAVLLPHHEDRLRAQLLALPVAGVGQFLLAAKQQPNLGPHALPFLLRELPRGVAIALNAVTAQPLFGPTENFP